MKKEYILVLNKNVTKDQFKKLLEKYNIEITVDFNALIDHYTVKFDETDKKKIKTEPEIYHLAEADAPVKLMQVQKINVSASGYGDNWGLSRICKRDNWNNNTWYPNSGEYIYYRTGKNVDVYVVDTGARLTHKEFTNRISVIYDHYNAPNSPKYGIDTQGHGTHVASIIAGTKYGVAKEAQILVSRVFATGGATLSAIISGINACLNHHKNKKTTGVNRPSVMNLSLGGPAQRIEEQAINSCINEGIVCVAAAGNDGKDLSEANYDVMPAEIARAITVGSINIQDKISNFSNYGWQIDVFAPGHYITAANFQNDNGELMLSGTSMAAPHVSGICALFLENHNITTDAAAVLEVHDWVRNNATNNTLVLTENVKNAKTANRLVFSEFIKNSSSTTTQKLIEVKRLTKNKIDIVETKGKPTTTTTFKDITKTVKNNDGSITTIITRNYTDTTIIPITITKTITPIITIIYSDGSSKIITEKSTIEISTREEKTVTFRSEIISEKTTNPPTKSSPISPLPSNPPNWWKSDRKWVHGRGRNKRFILNYLRRLEYYYDKHSRDEQIELLLAEIEKSSELLANSTKYERIHYFFQFFNLYQKIIELIHR